MSVGSPFMIRLELDPLPIETEAVIFDITRLQRARRRQFATGVDRIDLRIGLDLLERFGERCFFVAEIGRRAVEIRFEMAQKLLRALAAQWFGEGTTLAAGALERSVPFGNAVRARLGLRTDVPRLPPGVVATYVVASHSGLARRSGLLRTILSQRGLPCVAYIHDLIPLEFPEYQRPGIPEEFSHFMDQLAAVNAAFVTNSEDTGQRLRVLGEARGWPPTSITPIIPRLAFHTQTGDQARPEITAIGTSGKPYFVTLGTIEPRKNHLLLLNIWRELASAGEAPDLHIVGRRGWENEMVLDMLDRCEAIGAVIHEHPDLSDAEVSVLLRGARALLFPSFAEGLGIPLLEAQAIGTPCVASDIPALQEIAVPGTRLLDPLDGPGWRAAIQEMAAGGG